MRAVSSAPNVILTQTPHRRILVFHQSNATRKYTPHAFVQIKPTQSTKYALPRLHLLRILIRRVFEPLFAAGRAVAAADFFHVL